MKTSLTPFCTLARIILIFALAVLPAVSAEGSQYGTVGLFSDTSATVNQIEASGGQLPLYLVAMDPADDMGQTPSSLTGFEGRISFEAVGDFVMQVQFPVDVINIGSDDNLIVGFGTPIPLSGSSVVLATVLVYTQGGPESNIFLGPASPASVPGYMVVVDDSFAMLPMEPASGDAGRPVFFINSQGYQTSATWGAAKIQYR